MRDGDFADGGDGGGAALEAGKEETLEGVPIICFDNEKEDVLGVGSVPADEFDARGVGVKKGVGAALVYGAGLGGVTLGDVKEH
jgi:hypothetical protein